MHPARDADAEAGPGAFPHAAPTAEVEWLEWIDALPDLSLDADRLLVVAPHPDDETLACGGLIAAACRAGAEVRVLTVTGGEGSHPGQPGLVDIRRREQEQALRALGVDTPIRRLELPDSGVHHHTAEVADHIEAMSTAADAVLAPWEHDGHTDHDACGAAARAAACRTGVRLLAYPVWAWQWARPTDLAGPRWRRWHRPEAAHLAKQRAIDCFPSQTTDRLGRAIVTAPMLERFARAHEVYADVG